MDLGGFWAPLRNGRSPAQSVKPRQSDSDASGIGKRQLRGTIRRADQEFLLSVFLLPDALCLTERRSQSGNACALKIRDSCRQFQTGGIPSRDQCDVVNRGIGRLTGLFHFRNKVERRVRFGVEVAVIRLRRDVQLVCFYACLVDRHVKSAPRDRSLTGSIN